MVILKSGEQPYFILIVICVCHYITLNTFIQSDLEYSTQIKLQITNQVKDIFQMLLYAYISSDINIVIHLSLSIQVTCRGQPSRLLPL